MTKSQDPYGQSDIVNGNAYGFKTKVQHMINAAKKELAQLQRLLHAQDEIVNDATRAAVYRELIADLRQQAGDAAYHAAYEVAGMKEAAERFTAWADYLSKYGWADKYTVDGEPKLMTLEDKVDEAYINGGAQAVIKLMSK
jgi:hypothetical protein